LLPVRDTGKEVETQVCVRKKGNLYPWCRYRYSQEHRKTQVCVRKIGITYPWCLSEIPERK